MIHSGEGRPVLSFLTLGPSCRVVSRHPTASLHKTRRAPLFRSALFAFCVVSMASFSAINLQPKADLFLEAIRNVGYSFDTAVADILDNSIAANAKTIDLWSSFTAEDKKPALAICDDGFGMSPEKLLDSMRFAHQELNAIRDGKDLGRFGLGMKLASLSQARSVLVIAKGNDKTLSAACWDIDYIKQVEEWELQSYNGDDSAQSITEILLKYGLDDIFEEWHQKDSSGVMVCWLSIDRFLCDDFSVRLANLRTHLSLVFHRYLEGRVAEKVQVKVDGKGINPSDPYLLSHPYSSSADILSSKGVRAHAHVLPYMSELSRDDWKVLGSTANEAKGTLQSGFYIYRVNRLIVWGKWFGLVPNLTTRKLVRVELDIDAARDDEWNLDVRKSRAEIPTYCHQFILSSIALALERSRRKIEHVTTNTRGKGDNAPLWIFEENKEKKSWSLRINRESQSMKALKASLSDTGKLDDLLNELERYFPYEALRARYQSFELEEGMYDRA